MARRNQSAAAAEITPYQAPYTADDTSQMPIIWPMYEWPTIRAGHALRFLDAFFWALTIVAPETLKFLDFYISK
jgi:hypothetical protein